MNDKTIMTPDDIAHAVVAEILRCAVGLLFVFCFFLTLLMLFDKAPALFGGDGKPLGERGIMTVGAILTAMNAPGFWSRYRDTAPGVRTFFRALGGK